MSKDQHYVICGNVDRVGGSLPTSCATCGTDLVISPATKSSLPPDAIVLCFPCAIAEMRLHDHVEVRGPTPAQLKELKGIHHEA